jgi:hypothetical protein
MTQHPIEPAYFVNLGRLDNTRELLYIFLSDIHEGTVPTSELRGKIVNQLIHWHSIADNSEMSALFEDVRLLKDIKFQEKFKLQSTKVLPDVTSKEVADRIKKQIKSYIAVLSERIDGKNG